MRCCKWKAEIEPEGAEVGGDSQLEIIVYVLYIVYNIYTHIYIYDWLYTYV